MPKCGESRQEGMRPVDIVRDNEGFQKAIDEMKKHTRE